MSRGWNWFKHTLRSFPAPGFHFTQEKDFLKITYWRGLNFRLIFTDIFFYMALLGVYLTVLTLPLILKLPAYIHYAYTHFDLWWARGFYPVILGEVATYFLGPFFILFTYAFAEHMITSSQMVLNTTHLRAKRVPTTPFNKKSGLSVPMQEIETTYVDEDRVVTARSVYHVYQVFLILKDESIVALPFGFVDADGVYASRVALMIEDFLKEHQKQRRPRKQGHLADQFDEYKETFGWNLPPG